MRELENEIWQDKISDFFAQYGKEVIGLIVFGLLAFGGYLWWDARNEGELEKSSEELVAATEQARRGNAESAKETASKLASSASPEHKAFAAMLRAGVAIAESEGEGGSEEAAKLFGEVAKDSSAPKEIRDLARIREMSTTFDARKPQEVIAALKDVAVPGNPFFGSAGELVAMAHLEAGDKGKAGVLFAELARNEEVPDTLRSRARQMAGLLGVDAIEDVDALLEAQGVETASQANKTSDSATATVQVQ